MYLFVFTQEIISFSPALFGADFVVGLDASISVSRRNAGACAESSLTLKSRIYPVSRGSNRTPASRRGRGKPRGLGATPLLSILLPTNSAEEPKVSIDDVN